MMTRTGLIGWTGLAVCALGYVGGTAVVVMGQMDMLAKTPALFAGGVILLIGEIGLWTAAACLGFSIFRKRKAFIDRVFRRVSARRV